MSTLLDSLLTTEQLRECREHEHQCSELARVVRGEPYTWANVPWRTERVADALANLQRAHGWHCFGRYSEPIPTSESADAEATAALAAYRSKT